MILFYAEHAREKRGRLKTLTCSLTSAPNSNPCQAGRPKSLQMGVREEERRVCERPGSLARTPCLSPDSADDARYVFYSVPQTGFLAVIEPENKQTKFKLHFLDPSGDTPPRGLIFPMRASLRFLILVAWMLSNPSLGHFRVSKSISIVQTTINRKPRGRGRVSPPTCGFTRNHLRKFLPMIYAQLCH